MKSTQEKIVLEKEVKYPIGTLVEVIESGVLMFVVNIERDDNDNLLYELSLTKHRLTPSIAYSENELRIFRHADGRLVIHIENDLFIVPEIGTHYIDENGNGLVVEESTECEKCFLIDGSNCSAFVCNATSRPDNKPVILKRLG